jgi:serine/threonine protein kinase
MAKQQQQQENPIGFKIVQLFKDQILGIGSYGKVCRAKCDDLVCAAKIMHETLFDPTAQQLIAPHREHRLPMRRFEQECEFLSTIRHPNIIQYLGIYRDPDTGLPVLLMELMDDSLTHFLESSPQPIPYHIQINVCHDVTRALSFLHSNDIVHRDLSSNNVLLIDNVRAKVTDFGMARLGDQNPRATQLTFTMCPGTDVYMPPEAVQEEPVYTEKIDCFSFGVIALQILSRQFPAPGNRKRRVPISLSGLPSDTIAEVPIPEIERRQNHIHTVDPNHPLLLIALDCLKDKDLERPSAQQLCERVGALKEHPRYNERVRVHVEARSTAEQGGSNEIDRLRQQYSEQIQGLQQIIQSQTSWLEEKDQAITQREQELREKDQTIMEGQQQLRQQLNELEKEKNQAVTGLEKQLGQLNQQLEQSEREVAQFQQQIPKLRLDMDIPSRGKQNSRASIKLTWRKGEKAPCMTVKSHSASVDDSILYVRVPRRRQVYGYTISTSSWSRFPNSPTENCPSVIINNLLTLVGGSYSGVFTNQLISLTEEGSGIRRRWTEEFPPMPTKRESSTALTSGTALIVAGGRTRDSSLLKTIEVLNTTTKQWSAVADLPQPLCDAPAAVCGEYIYILRPNESKMYACSVLSLVQSSKLFLASLWKRGTGVWMTLAAPPVTQTSFVSIHDQLLAIGGNDSDWRTTTAIHVYNSTADSWEVISHMATPRRLCVAAVLPNNQLMVVGGRTGRGIDTGTNSVELATIEYYAVRL